MEITQLSYFVRVADTGGFSRASAQLGLTQSTVSRQVGLLEEELGQRLFIRTGRGAQLSEAGKTFLQYANAMLAANQRAREALEDLTSSPRGKVTIGLPPRIAYRVVPSLIQNFRASLPNAVITVSEGLSQHLRELLIADRLHMAVLFDPPSMPQLHYEELGTDRLLVVTPTHYRIEHGEDVLDQISGWDFILPSRPHAIRAQVDAAAEARNMTLNVVAEVDSVRSVLALVKRGVGCSVLPESTLTSEACAIGLKVASIGYPPIMSRLVLATPTHGVDSKLLRETRRLVNEAVYPLLAARHASDPQHIIGPGCHRPPA